MKLGLLCSGGLGVAALKQLHQEHQLLYVATDSGSQHVTDFCQEHGLALFTGNPRAGRLASFLDSRGLTTDLLLSVNYLFIVEADVLARAGRAINLHGSLLPKYRGRTPHVWAIINNESQTGVTAHFIDHGCDTGDVVLQKVVHIGRRDTGADILERYAALYPEVIREVIALHQSERLSGTPQDHSKATYFGRRTPQDGEIDWGWSRERIYNWIRAQSAPYPGAYSFAGGLKVVVDFAELSDLGFHFEQTNGLVLEGGETPTIKTPDGALRLLRLRDGLTLPQGALLGSHLPSDDMESLE